MDHGEQKGCCSRDGAWGWGNQKCMILYPNTYIYVSREKGEMGEGEDAGKVAA